ncbi:hypothetical protein CRUP_031212 [Coryphaenoides rupestris]|nr:hypothetical protein CRUP_031212 [Coryphaenoides rupestris]
MYEGKHIHFSEVDNKPLCSYSPKLCKQRRLNGYAFCIRHVLEDKTAPFKQCEYVAKYNSQRCTNPIPKAEDRRYCNSHLQVLGFIPKKERKKKQETLEEMRSRPHLESVALNITVPSLTLKVPNGGLVVDDLPASPPCTRLLLPLPDGELLDPFAFSEEEDTDGEEMGIPPRKSALVRKRPQNHRLLLNPKLHHHDTEPFPLPLPPPEHFSPSSRHPSTATSPASIQDIIILLIIITITFSRLRYRLHRSSSITTPTRPSPFSFQDSRRTPNFLPPGLPPNAAASPTQTSAPSLSRKQPPFTATHSPGGGCKDGASGGGGGAPRHVVVMRPVGFSPPAACLARLQHLVQLCAKRRQDYGDLFPHLGLDWSEDSGEDNVEVEEAEAEVERDRPLHSSWRPQDGLEEEGCSSRRTRLLRLCSYLQEKYKHIAGPTGVLQQHAAESGICTGSTKGQACHSSALPFTRHCFQHIMLNRSQQLFSSCTAKFADGQQCSIPVFDITHQTPLCEEHAKKMDNFLRGDGNRRVQQQQQRKPRKKTKPPALTKKHKKKRRRGPRRPQKPIPPALPQGNLGMPSTSLSLPSQASIRSPSTPDLSAEELPDDITNEIADIPNDLELNQEDFSDVLPRLPGLDLQDFDLFEGKNGELLPTTEEAEELVRALQAMGSYPESLVCLGDLASSDGVDHRHAVFPGPGQPGAMGDLLNGRMPPENFAGLELEANLLQASDGGHHFPLPLPPQSQPPASPPPCSGAGLVSASASTTAVVATTTSLTERTFSRTIPSQVLDKSDAPLAAVVVAASPQSSHYGSEHVPSPYSDNISSPHTAGTTATFQPEPPLLLEVPLSGLPCPPRSAWNHLSLSVNDPTPFGSLLGAAEGHLVSTSLSTPPAATHSVTLQPMAALSAIPQRGPAGLTGSSPSLSPASSPHDLLTSTQPKQQLPQFSASFGHQLACPHSGIPTDPQFHGTPAGFSIASTAAAASANSSTTTVAPFPQSN